MKPRVGVIQFHAICPEGNEFPLSCGITYEIARRLTSIGGIDANAILPGNGGPALGVADGSTEAPLFAEKNAGFLPTIGAQFESDYILVGTARIVDGLLFYYRVYEVESGRLIRNGCITGLRSNVFRLLDELAQEAQRAIGCPAEDDDTEADFNPVYDSVDFEAFVEFCLAREAMLPPNAMDHLERALKLEPGFRMALVEYLSHCYQIDEMASSLHFLDAYLEAFPEDQEILIAAANLCLAFHRVEKGLAYANRAFVQQPGDVEPRVLLARFLFAKEMPHEARIHLDAALRAKDSTPEAFYCLGRYFLDLGDVYRARNYFEECLGVDPGYFVALRDLQCCYYELGDFPLGIEACERLLESDPTDAGSYYNLGLIYQKLGRVHLALKYFEESVRQDPGFYKAVYMVGEHLYSRGEFRQALERFQEALRIAPSSSEALGRVGDCHYELARSREALWHYERARREDVLFESARHHLIEGRTLAGDGDLEGARLRLLKATELDEGLPEAWNELGGVLLQQGKAEEALDVVRRAVELDPDHPSLLANLLTCCSRLPLGVRLSGWARRIARETRERLRYLRTVGVTPSPGARRRYHRRLRTLTWYALRG